MEEHVLVQLARKFAKANFLRHEELSSDEASSMVMTYQAAKELSRCHKLKKEQQLVLLLAATFLNHRLPKDDVTFLKERLSMFKKFQQTHCLDASLAQQITSCMQNSFTEFPESILDKILCDAMSYYLSTHSYLCMTSSACEMRSRQERLDSALHRLAFHRFHTDYAKRYFYPGIKENLQRLNASK